MENKADVKAIMARFQASGASTDETSSTPAGCTKQPLHPTFSSGPTLQKSHSGGAINIPPKPSLLKNTVSTKSDTDAHEPIKTKALASRFGNTQNDTNTNNKPFAVNKQQIPLKPSLSQAPEAKGPVQKLPFNKTPLSSTLSDSKPVFPKPSPTASSKPSWVKEDSGGGAALNTSSKPSWVKEDSGGGAALNTSSKPSWVKEDSGGGAALNTSSKPSWVKEDSGGGAALNTSSKPSWVKEDSGGGAALNTNSTPPKIPNLQQKPSSNFIKLRQQNEELAGANTDGVNKPSPQANSTFKPPSNFRTAQNMFKEKDKTEQTDSGGVIKPPLTATNSTPPPKPPASKKPSIKKPPKASPQTSNDDATSGPKRNPLPNSLALGAAPAKPNRPPKVNLENFKRGAEASDDGPGFRKPNMPTPLTSHLSNHSNHVNQTQPPQTVLPSLPPRHPGTMNQQEDFYDDVDELHSSPPPPPLPPSAGHPSQRGKEEIDDDDDDGDMYEPLDERWEVVEHKQDKKKEKEDKEEKKRLEAERKEQKREQDARKKFKLVGPIEVIHQGKARTDCRGGKTDLALKQGDSLDIIRVMGNPEGKWLGRTQDGSIGYVKTTSVEIDFNSLKNRQAHQAYEPEVYDDIDVVSSDNSGIKGPGVVLPPLPGEEGEIYDDVLDPNLEVSPLDPRSSPVKPRGFLRMFDRNRRLTSTKEVPPPSQFTAEGNSDQSGAPIDEEIYDDVDAQQAPPLPPLSSLPVKCRSEEMDPKKQKKFEKEEKDFRKKFKYDREIQVLFQVTITPTLTHRKWGGKDLPVKAGEKLDVIVKAVDNKFICRNEDGKFGYVSTCYIDMDDGDIYDDIGDDIGDDCIYDND